MILVFQIGQEPEQRRAVVLGRITIGRASSCDVVVDHEGVEPDHCHLVRRDGRWFVEDRQTVAGTVVRTGDGAAPHLVLARAHPFAIGDELLIGHHATPRLRAHFEISTLPAARDELTASPSPVAATPEASTPTSADRAASAPDAPLPLGDLALRVEVQNLRAALAGAQRAHDVLAHELEGARIELAGARTELERARRDATYASELAQQQLANRASEIASQQRYLAEQRQELDGVTEALRGERRQHEALRALTRCASSDLDDVARIAQERATVIESMSGDLAMLRSQLAEQTHLAENLTRENARLHREYDPKT